MTNTTKTHGTSKGNKKSRWPERASSDAPSGMPRCYAGMSAMFTVHTTL